MERKVRGGRESLRGWSGCWRSAIPDSGGSGASVGVKNGEVEDDGTDGVGERETNMERLSMRGVRGMGSEGGSGGDGAGLDALGSDEGG